MRGGVRNSNIELFRILSMLTIVAHHYVVNSGMLDCMDAQAVLTWRDYFLLLFGWGGKTGINCFVLITGYFMCKAEISLQKFGRLLAEVEFYKILFFVIFCLTGYEAFSIKEFAKAIFPFFNISTGFVSCYLLFYLLIPFLNKLLCSLDERKHLLLMVWCLFVYTVLPSFAKANVTFNYITWFCVLYVIAAYLRLYPKEWFGDQRLMGILMVAGIVLSWGSVAAMAYASRILNKGIGLAYFFVSDSNKVLALATSLPAFLFFRNLKIGYSRHINKIAASAFGVLMIHANSDTMRRFLWKDVCRNAEWYASPYLALHAAGCVLGVYVLCTVIDIVRIRVIEQPVLARISEKILKR